ncbi:proline-rich transmembrane protein 4 [Spea bombifrons]|uniref:proline-rich transmembrane protein 4 n=1 Tax=Spea bombifrons TaxID=233779 RepID=UPI0023493CB6|nr:proline-rich transmembrane protein 4 [Spea bombifrons]
MGSTHWTFMEIFLLTLFHFSSQEVQPTQGLVIPQAIPTTGFVSLKGYLPTQATTIWLQNNEVLSSVGSQDDDQSLNGATHDVPIAKSEELQIDLVLQGSTVTQDGSLLQTASRHKPANGHSIEITTNEPSNVPVSHSSTGGSEIPFQFSSFTTDAVYITLETFQEATLISNTAPPFSELIHNDDSTMSTTAAESFSLSDVISFAPSPEGGSATQQPELKPSKLSPVILSSHVDDLEEKLVTEGEAFGTTEINPGDNLEASVDVDGQLTEQISEESSISPSIVTEKAVTSDADLDSDGYTTTEDSTSFRDCGYPDNDNCNFTNTSSNPSLLEVDPTLQGQTFNLLSPPIFITLQADWNTSVADWGVAWEALVYGSVGFFGTVALLALLSLFCLVFRCPPGTFYFAILHLLLITVGSSRAFVLFYDAYGHQDRLPVFTAMVLHDLAFPCMTASFSIAFLLLSSRCRLQHSSSSFPRLCILSTAALLHFAVSAGAVVIVDILHQFLFLLLVSRGVYVVLTALLSLSFFIFYCLAKTQNTQIYDLKSSAPPTEYTRGCPFADSKDWNRAAWSALMSAFFGLLNSGLQLYSILYAIGYGGSVTFGPWPWWAFQLSSILCEVGTCLPLAIVGAYPIFCTSEIERSNCWTKLFRLSPGRVTMKTSMLPTNSQWASSQHEKLLICDTIVRSDSEFFPLYTLVEKRLSVGDELSLIYNSSKSLEVPGLSLYNGSKTPSFISVQIDSDSTVDFRPPSPINLRRSIDEALFSESLIPQSLFHGTALSSSLSLTIKSTTQLEDGVFKENPSDRGLYRTSSCMEIESGLPIVEPAPSTARQDITETPSSGTFRGGESTTSSLYKMSLDGSSLVLCSSPEHAGTSSYSADRKPELSRQSQGIYHTLSPPSQESLDVTCQPENTLREDFKDVFGPIDALSVESDTIDL